MVSWVVDACPEGVTVVGLKEHEAPVGKLEQEKLTTELNPYCGVMVRSTVPWLPEFTVSDVGEASNVNVGEGAASRASRAVVVAVVPLLVPVTVRE